MYIQYIANLEIFIIFVPLYVFELLKAFGESAKRSNINIHKEYYNVNSFR